MATKDDILTIDQESQQKLVQYIEAAYKLQDDGWQLRNRLEIADRAYLREGDFSEEQRKAKLANTTGDKTKLQNMQVPMVMEDVETAVGFLTNVFLIDYPMFKFVSDPDKQDLALQWNSIVGEDQIHYGWAGEFNIGFRNGAKYNFAPMEIDWCEHKLYKPVNGTGEGGVKLEQMVWAGNKVEAHDPYNTIYDSRVPPHRVHTDGEFAGWIKQMSRIKLKLYLASLGDDRLKNDKAAFQAGAWAGVEYYTPNINPSVFIKNSSWLSENFNWTKWAFSGAQNHIHYSDMYTVACLYARIMPFEFKIRAPRDQTPDIWKLVCVNGVLVYAKPMINAHDILPMIIVQPHVDNLGHQTKSQAENQVPFQDMTSALFNAKLQSARRRVTDRMLYNPLLVDPDHINSPNPSAKIPIRPTAYGRKLEEAIYQIPFDDSNSQFFIQEANMIAEWGMRAQGRNRPMMGQFQKGNKLESEWNETMANAGARDRSQALMWETFGMQPIKTIIKNNILQMVPAGKRYHRTEEKTVVIDPIQLRKAAAEFEIGDGLLPVQRLVRTDIMQNGFQTLAALPALAAGYDLPPMFSYLMKVQGVDKLAKFEKTPEQRQYEQQLGAWQMAAQEVSKGHPDWTPEQVQKAIGPQPQPPQQVTNTQTGTPNAGTQT